MNVRIGDLIDVPPVKTVVRLEEGRTHSAVITSSFVCTADVSAHLNVLAASFMRDSGAGCFVEGDFGSGKSHFLAALSVWLDDRPGAQVLTGANETLARYKNAGRRLLPVELSLVDFRAATPLERIITSGIEAALERRGIDAALSPLKRFMRHLRSILEAPLVAADFTRQTGIAADGMDRWFEEQPREAWVKSAAFLKSQGVDAPETLVEERRDVFERAVSAVAAAGFNGMVLLLDELSEFFRSKPDPAALNEDARTLQLLGEIAGSRPLWIIAAVQESIERTGDIASATFRKIKDRFPVRLHLSTLHIRDLIAKRLVRHREGMGERLRGVYEEYRRHFPRFTVPFDRFRAIYPLHPQTLALLEGLGELFSQHRGIVDFVHARTAGDPSRNIPGILDRPAGELLAPDALYDHFCARLAEISAFHDYPRRIIPHLDEVIGRLVDGGADRELTRRLVRILVLYAIHPTAQPPSARLLAEMAGCMLTASDPDANAQFVAGVLLDPLVTGSRFVRKQEAADPADAVYTISTREDHAANLQARIRQAMADLRTDDSRILLEPLGAMGQDLSWPGSEVLQGASNRLVVWRQSVRRAAVVFLHPGEEQALAGRLEALLDAGEADCALVLATGKTPFAVKNTMVWRFCPDGFNHAVLIEYFAALTVSRELHPGNPAHAPLVTPAAETVRRLEPAARQAVVDLLYAGGFDDRTVVVDPAALRMRRFERLLEIAAEQVLDLKYPRFRQIAPRQPVTLRSYQRLLDELVAPGAITISEARAKGLVDAVETLAVPLGLIELKSGSYRLAPALGEHPFLTYVLSLLRPAGPTPREEVVRQMAAGEWGVPRDMAHFTLATLAQCGILAVQRQGRTVPLDLMPMTGIESADAIIPGELISQADRETLMTHCPFLAPSGGWPSFGLRQQREAWQALLKFKSSFETVLAETAQRSAAVERYSAFSSFDFASLRETGDALARVLSEIKVSYHAREGVERFLAAWRASGLAAPDVDRIRKTHRFFTRFAENFIHIALYLRHPAVEAACGADAEIARRRDAVALMLDDPLTFVVPDEGTQIGAAFDLFREVYAEGYDRGHRDWNKARQPAKLDRSQERMMQLFDRLSLIEQLDRPPALDALLSSRRNAAAGACGRSVAEELLRSPVCGCGFHLGMAAAGAAADDTGARIDGAFTAYRDILAAPETLEALTAHAFALRDMDGGVAERLDKLAACLRDRKGAPHALLDLLDDRTVAEIGRALSGSMKVQQRSIRSLTDELAGKKLTPRRLRQIFDQWAGQEQENTLLSVDGREPSGGADAQCAPCWWPRLHPGLFGGNAGQVDPDVAGAIGRQLEAHYPAAQLQKRLAALDEGELASFISGESFHTAALQAAWPLLVKRTLEQSAGRFKAPGASRHALPEVADALNSRFKALESAHRWCAEDFPHRLRARVHAAALWTDQWAAAGSRTAADRFIAAVAHQATDWLETLAPVETVDCADSPVVLVLDALAPDVWLETAERLGAALDGAQTGWRRLRSAPGTVDSLAALFAFPADRDPVEAFAVAGATYVTLRGDEERPVTDLIDPLDKDGARIVRFNLLDGAAHGAKLPLNLMPQVLASALSRHLPPLVAQCAARRRPLLLTADHGLSWNKGALTHGKGGVFEEAVVRVTW